MSDTTLFKTVMNSTFVHVGFAFLAMGSWAVFANRAHPMPEPFLAGLVQGTLSGTIALVMKKALEALSRKLFAKQMIKGALFLPPLIVCSISLMVLAGAHLAAGTPELAATIALPFSVAFSYACLYAYNLWREERINHE
ncbi:MAG: hypothetical protein L3J05_07630 [Robiginitomaculum sp.]|nr:hypothetical protein [Robiginitomaculum sp.]